MMRPRRCLTMIREACTLVSQAALMVPAVSRQMPALSSQNRLDHSAMVAPQAESTMRSSRPCSSSTRRNKATVSSSLPRSARTGMPWPPRAQTSSAVSSTVPGVPSAGLGPWREVRAATYTVAPASPSASAMPLPAPRLDPATIAIFPCKFLYARRPSALHPPPAAGAPAGYRPRPRQTPGGLRAHHPPGHGCAERRGRARGGGAGGLLEGYHTKLTGLSAAEIQSLFLARPPRLMADLGLKHEADAAMIKLQASLPADSRQHADFARQRILVDTRGWRDPAESVACLPVLLDALWRERQVRFVYARVLGEPGERTADP